MPSQDSRGVYHQHYLRNIRVPSVDPTTTSPTGVFQFWADPLLPSTTRLYLTRTIIGIILLVFVPGQLDQRIIFYHVSCRLWQAPLWGRAHWGLPSQSVPKFLSTEHSGQLKSLILTLAKSKAPVSARMYGVSFGFVSHNHSLRWCEWFRGSCWCTLCSHTIKPLTINWIRHTHPLDASCYRFSIYFPAACTQILALEQSL